MTRQLASIRTLTNIQPIPKADRVELAHIDGWRSVIPKNQFTIGEQILFLETDCAILNVNDPRFDFLKKSCYKSWTYQGRVIAECLRIKTIKMANQISQGVVLKLADFQNELTQINSITALLNIQHYDDLLDNLKYIMGTSEQSKAMSSFPSFIPKTDEERIQNLPEYLDGRFATLHFEATVKLDGSSMTVGYSPTYYPNDPYFVCSRNLRLYDDNTQTPTVARNLNLKNILKTIHEQTGNELCLQGELIGPGINNNNDKQTTHSFNVFRIWNITTSSWLSTQDRYNLCLDNNIPHVPIYLHDCTILDGLTTIEQLIQQTDMKTPNGNPIEGLVFKSLCGTIHFKVINPQYLLKNDN